MVKAKDEGKGETIISKTCNFEGILKSDGEIKVYGSVQGEIETASSLFVGKGARVLANVAAQNVGVAGMLKGSVSAVGRVEILSGASVYGDIVASSLRIEEGAVFSGQSRLPDESMIPQPTELFSDNDLKGEVRES
ncbi:MAG: polymer-forming cytoskeletal protein [Chloroflexi bacterium]|nr:polymer-forming cytoskeletal protein [Chloroflexota bacterium]